ncbi:MAG: N-acetylgalactosamine 6-sulfate sulfatase, partial [Rhodothermales bacterium]|nr:N-acetylgalactosamine 6-sulfate sulfatase [Rhodothermales bacterium]
FIRWPEGRLTGGRDVDQLSAHIDVLPTLAQLADLELPGSLDLDGVSLDEALLGNVEVLRDRTVLVHSQRVPVPIKWRKSAVMSERWRLVNQHELYDIKADPAQSSDVADDHPDVVKRLQNEYESWWTSLSTSFDHVVRIGVGSDQENPTKLSAHDWFVSDQSQSPWSQNHIRNGHIGNGHWEIDVQKPGDYRITLRRWPSSAPGPIEAISARVQVGDAVVESDLAESAESASFQVALDPGPTRLQTWLELPSGESRGAYYVSVERLSDD